MLEIKALFTVLVSGIAYILGGWDKGLEFLVIAVALDYIVGIATAIYLKQFSYEICYRGIYKKLGFFGAIAIAVLIERLIGQPETIHPLVCYGFVISESFSVCKNLKLLGVPIPDFFMKRIEDMGNAAKEEPK